MYITSSVKLSNSQMYKQHRTHHIIIEMDEQQNQLYKALTKTQKNKNNNKGNIK